MFFNSLAGSDTLHVSSENAMSVCKDQRNLIKKEVPDPVSPNNVIGLGDVGLLRKTLG